MALVTATVRTTRKLYVNNTPIAPELVVVVLGDGEANVAADLAGVGLCVSFSALLSSEPLPPLFSPAGSVVLVGAASWDAGSGPSYRFPFRPSRRT